VRRFGGFVAAQQVLDTDKSAGPHHGRIYLAYADRPDPVNRPLDTDVYLQFSDDHGQTWSPRQRVNDDGVDNSQFFPSLSVDRVNGEVVLSWYDTRRDSVNHEKTDVFLAVGTPTEDGVRFGPNRRITKEQSDESAANPQARGHYGDYEGIVAYAGVAHPVWSDDRPDNPLVGGVFHEALYTANIEYGLRGGEDDDAMGAMASPRLPEPAPQQPLSIPMSASEHTLLLPRLHTRRASHVSSLDEWDSL
jgi:hypothetical protein